MFLLFVYGRSFADIAVPFEMINGLIVVEAELNGIRGNYIIDSGANGVLLNRETHSSSVSYQTLESTLEGSESNNNRLKIGDFKAEEISAFSTDLSNIELYISTDLAGIVGCAIFSPYSLAFDFKNTMLIISDEKVSSFDLTDYSQLSFYMHDDLPMVDLEIGDKMKTFILDSGASSHFVDLEQLKSIESNFKATGIEKNIVTAGGQNKMSRQYLIEDCKIGNQSNQQIEAYNKDFSSMSTILEKEIAGLLSLSNLSSNLVYFDLKSKTLYFQ